MPYLKAFIALIIKHFRKRIIYAGKLIGKLMIHAGRLMGELIYYDRQLIGKWARGIDRGLIIHAGEWTGDLSGN